METRSVVLIIDSQKILVDLLTQALQGDRLEAFRGPFTQYRRYREDVKLDSGCL